MRVAVILGLALTGCIEDPSPSGDPDETADARTLDAQLDGGLRRDRSVGDARPADARPADASLSDAARDSAPVIDRGPLDCDQPDPGACDAAGCRWSDLAGCEEPRDCGFNQADCDAASACTWGPRPDTGEIACRPAAGSTCSGWLPDDCRAIEACLVLQGTCIPAIDAPCDQVAPRDCWRSAHCVEEYAAECGAQPKQQEPPRLEPDAGLPDPEPGAEPEPAPECFGPGECGDGEWCRREACVSCDLPERCADAR